MSARKRKAVPARLSANLRADPESGVVDGDPEVNGYSDSRVTGSRNGNELAEPEVEWRHVSGDDVMESIRSVIGSAPTVEDKQRRLNALIHQLQLIKDQLMQQHLQQVTCAALACHVSTAARCPT